MGDAQKAEGIYRVDMCLIQRSYYVPACPCYSSSKEARKNMILDLIVVLCEYIAVCLASEKIARKKAFSILLGSA
jgi:hypothetical protein